MPLNVQKLSIGLGSIFRSMPTSGAEAAMRIASEYDSYCRLGMAPPGLPMITPASLQALAASLSAVLGQPNGTAASVAAAFSSGIQAFWLSPPVLFVGGPASGVATAIPGASAAIPLITSALQNLANSEDTAAAQIAAALDTATRTVLVVYSTPPPPSGPPPPATVI